jgi:acetyl-CoA carboxylase biotin carboxylase subunit
VFGKVLIANRGEIACRVIRTCRDLGIRTVVVYSEVDRTALHVLLADEAYPIGGSAAAESYLVGEKILDVALAAGAEAIHPGYGFLSENPEFQQACAAKGIAFIGPSAAAMIAMGEKTLARETMEAGGVPVVPGTPALETGDLEDAAQQIGFPVMLKAAAGGGGKGMRVVESADELLEAFEAARRTALSAFGDDRVYMERFVQNPRHVEIQVLADQQGHTVYLFERECSVQRRHQKVIEEAPASRLSEETREKMGEIAVRAAQTIGYVNAGTVEFLVDADENFYFLEMNTRLQVEHPVTEAITGVDLVEQQLRIAFGESLPFTQEDLAVSGHAIECRIYAEDPEKDYRPSPGSVKTYRIPEGPGVRVDGGVYAGAEVSRHYDPMIAKLVVWGPDRMAAIARTRRALAEFHVGGIRTNIQLLKKVLDAPAFVDGEYDTGLLSTMDLQGSAEEPPLALLATVATFHREGKRAPRSTSAGMSRSEWSHQGRRSQLENGVE